MTKSFNFTVFIIVLFCLVVSTLAKHDTEENVVQDVGYENIVVGSAKFQTKIDQIRVVFCSRYTQVSDVFASCFYSNSQETTHDSIRFDARDIINIKSLSKSKIGIYEFDIKLTDMLKCLPGEIALISRALRSMGSVFPKDDIILSWTQKEGLKIQINGVDRFTLEIKQPCFNSFWNMLYENTVKETMGGDE